MAITKTIDIDVNSSNAEKNISKLNVNLNNLTDATVKVKDASKEFGLISEGTSQTLDKVQSGVETAVTTYKSFSGALKSFGIIQKITTAAQYVWNAAMAANPIGAVVAVVVALVAAGYALVRMFQASSEADQASANANKKLNQELQTQIESQKKATIESDLQRDSQLKMAKASGASGKEIRKLSEELANQEVKQKIANAETLKAIFLEARRVASLEDSTDAQKETAKVAFKALQDANKLAEDAVLNRRKLAIDNRVAERQEQTDSIKTRQEAEKIAIEDKLKDTKLSFQQQRNLVNNDNILTLKDKKDFLRKINEDEKAQKKKDLEDLKLALQAQKDATQININEVSDAISNAQDKQNEFLATAQESEEQKVKDKYFRLNELAKQQQRTQEEFDILDIQKLNELNDIKITAQNKYYEEQKILKDKEDAIEQAKFDLKINLYNQAASALGGLGALFKKNTAAAKVAALAEIAIGSATGLINGLDIAQKTAKGTGPAAAFAFPLFYATQVAAVFGAVGKAKALLGGGGGGGGSASASGGGGSAPATPQFNIVGQSSTNQLAQTISSQQKQPIKTYVVAGDVTTQQSLDRNAVQTSTFGN
jgi:hypothetical protein